MNCINNVKNYKYLFLVKKPDKIKNLKMVRKNVLTPAVIHTTINNKKKTYQFSEQDKRKDQNIH